MEKTCSTAYSIYTQYNNINKTCGERVNYFDCILKTFSKKTKLYYEDILIIVIYAENSIGNDTLNDEQKGRLTNTIATLKINNWPKEKMPIIINRLMDTIMN